MHGVEKALAGRLKMRKASLALTYAGPSWQTAEREKPKGGNLAWLGGRDSNPDSAVQSRMSYH